ncbi:MAG: stage IV sporulation protein A [Limnochordia bacterium]|jgi:stage IV sporulation protein A|nr:stage IV sporulation protein A [Bacillota bacterium]HOB07901.1 stage IV sporulation protein A [Limnochordia bacterium]NLH31194.1 stage IV sporulation protein A [Bacillota bacterium]HPT93432.1 stage IV sporulation protein A [Limnochordia bacterium]HPZ29946.1 stage IV sporulation protein A [Limnochordia bacterium]
MEKFDLFADIANRTGGSIYIGVVGPVRTGKSTFIKRFMDLFVLPNIHDIHLRERTNDELPQSGAGRMITTTEPKFVPEEPVEIVLQDSVRFRVRLVDCVGYTVPGAKGYLDEDGPRMVMTPWFDHQIPFQEAAEIGTRKVISEHSTIGLVVITDGSVTDLERDDYIEAEERVIAELKELEKPFVVVLNTDQPHSSSALELASSLEERYQVKVVPLDCLRMSQNDIISLLQSALYEFPVREVNFRLPRWVEELTSDHWLRQDFESAVYQCVESIERLRDVDGSLSVLSSSDVIESVRLQAMDMGIGRVDIQLSADRALFYQVLAGMTGLEVDGDHHLIRLMQDLSIAKREYDKLAAALMQVRETGYGIVSPSLDDITFEQPELIKQGRHFGIRLTASAPSIHLIRANITTEVTPLVGTEKQGEELMQSLTEEFQEDPDALWSRDFLGRSLQDLVREGIQAKLNRMPENAREKLQETLSKIINEGSGGLICIIL